MPSHECSPASVKALSQFAIVSVQTQPPHPRLGVIGLRNKLRETEVIKPPLICIFRAGEQLTPPNIWKIRPSAARRSHHTVGNKALRVHKLETCFLTKVLMISAETLALCPPEPERTRPHGDLS